MAIYHLHVGIVSRKTGRSAVAAAAYRSAEKLHNEQDGLTHDYTSKSNAVNAAAYRSGVRLQNERDGMTHDYTRKFGVVHSEIMLPKNAPKEFNDRETLWNAVEKSERRRDAQTARDIDVALPIEFDRQEQIEVLREYIQDNFVSKGMCADFAIHDKKDGNPHAHVLLTTRDVSEKGFEGKNRDWNKKSCLKSWRKNWADVCNKKLQEKGLDERIDNRTLKAQGIDREPTIHVGVSAKHMEQKGLESERAKLNREIIARNQAKSLHELKEGVCSSDKEIAELEETATEAKREMNIFRVKAEEIEERAEYIRNITERLDDLKAERNNIGVSKNIALQIQQLERSHEQATNYFKQKYKIEHEQATEEIERLKRNYKNKKHLQEKLSDKINSFTEEKETLVLEYQRQKLLAQISPHRQVIQDKLMELDKETHRQGQSVQDNILRTQIRRNLDIVTERNFQKILKEVRQEQARALIAYREREKEREYSRGFERGYF